MDIQQFAPITACLTKATLAAGTTSTLSTTGTTTYLIRSKFYTKGAITNQATPTTDALTGLAFIAVPANQGSIYAVGFNAAGTLLAVQGSVESLDVNGAFINGPQFGGLPLDFAMIGYIVIKAGSTASSAPGWVFGTSNMSAVTGITYTFVDATGLPDRPQIS